MRTSGDFDKFHAPKEQCQRTKTKISSHPTHHGYRKDKKNTLHISIFPLFLHQGDRTNGN